MNNSTIQKTKILKNFVLIGPFKQTLAPKNIGLDILGIGMGYKPKIPKKKILPKILTQFFLAFG